MKKATLMAVGVMLAGCMGMDNSPSPPEERKNEAMIDAPHISQLPEFDRGCEVTSLAMMLQHAGVKVRKEELASEVAKLPFEEDGKRGHPNEGFVGNMETFDESGIGVFHKPIAELGEKYLPGKIVDLTGQSFDKVLDHVADGRPVWVLVTSTFNSVPESEWEVWDTEQGEVKVTYRWHSVLLTGYDENHVYVNDPLDEKNRKLPKKEFIAGWEQFGNQAITYLE
ncbi:C39 family peptidase [Neobacillus sp. SCS-31]|uniref:C39 family peptidase n=1 Tax=Neobacillus oceani TaxID=3115292 RepID=UPI00390597D2